MLESCMTESECGGVFRVHQKKITAADSPDLLTLEFGQIFLVFLRPSWAYQLEEKTDW